MKIEITPAMKRLCFELGVARNGSKRPEATRRKSDVFDDIEVHHMGIVGEAAAAIALGCKIDRSIGPGDGGRDLTLPNGETVSVKFTHRWEGYLMVEGQKNDRKDWLNDLQSDYIVLTHGHCSPPVECTCRHDILNPTAKTVVEVVGFLAREDFMRLRRVSDWGLGIRHWVPVNELQPIEYLASQEAA